MEHSLLLDGVGINSVAVVHEQSHANNSNKKLLVYKSTSGADFTGVDPDKISLGESMYQGR
jgi:hypothetical protein